MLAQDCLVVGVELNESTGNTEAESFCLAFIAAAVKIYLKVIFFGNFENRQGLLYDVLKN